MWKSMFAALLGAGIILAGCSSKNPVEPGLDNDPRLLSYAYRVLQETRGTPYVLRLEQRGEVDLAADKEYASFDIAIGNLSTSSETIRSGQQRWLKGDVPMFDVLVSTAGRPPLPPPLSLPRGAGTPETVNGTPALRYELSSEQFADLAALPPPVAATAGQPAATLWLAAEGGYPLRLHVVTPLEDEPGAMHLEVDVERINLPVTFSVPRQASAIRVAADGDFDWGRYLQDVIDDVIGKITGVSPMKTKETVEIVAEATPAIMEKVEQIEEYRNAHPDEGPLVPGFIEPPPGGNPADKTGLSDRFFRWLSSLTGR